MKRKDRKNLFGWLDFGTGIAGVAANILSTILTNKKNQEIAREQNALQVRESEKAYERGKPINQVAQMQAAGMSKAGALNAINGGATYQPAPMTSAQAQAPQVDLTTAFDGLMQIGENAKQRKMQEDLQEQQIKAAEQAQKVQIESDEKKHAAALQTQKEIAQLQADTTNRNADNRLAFDKEQFEYNKPKVLAEIDQIKQNTKVLKAVAKGHNLDNIRKEFENMRLPTLAKLADISAWQNIEYVAMKLAHENAEHMNKQERESLELEFLRATMDSGISLQNVQNELQTYLSNTELNTYKTPIVGNFIGALCFAMNNLVPKFALFK